MSEISVGSAVGAGFQLIRQRPVSVLVWGLIRVGFIVAIFAIYAPVMMGIVAEAIAARAQTGGAPAPARMSEMMSHMMVLQGVGYLVQFVGLFVNSVILCAIARSIVHPDRRAFASLRLGAPEFYMVILSFAAGIALAFAIVIFAIPFGIAAAFMAVQHLYAGIALVVALALLILVLGLVYVAARFAFVAPMMVDDGQFHLFDAWSLTKGRVGGIILIGLCLFLIALLFGMLIDGVLIALGAAILGVAAGGLNHLQAFFQQPPTAIITTLAPSLILVALLAIPVEGCALAIFIAPWARAYRDVAPGPAAPATVTT